VVGRRLLTMRRDDAAGRAIRSAAKPPRLLLPSDDKTEKVAARAALLGAVGHGIQSAGLMTARRADQIRAESEIDYSICTLVTKPAQYQEMVASFEAGGFGAPGCEYLYLDNSRGNEWDAYRGYNLFLNVARGRHIILCHQDVVLLEDGRARLDAIIAELDRLDPAWGLLGNAGGRALGELALRISDPGGGDRRRGELPARVHSLDENFIVVRRAANLALSSDLAGFHFYGADLCLVGDLLGRSAYVVDFHLRHKGKGTCDAVFYAAHAAIAAKYRRALRPRYIETTCATLFISGSRALQFLLSRGKSIVAATWLGKLRRRFLG
jgi:hypothetical protein